MPELKLAVIGDPVAHSASPRLHTAFLREANLHGTYEAIEVAAGTAAVAIDRLRAAGYTGLNVTTPLKEEAFARADERDAAAIAAGSVNTLVLRTHRIAGYNTDGLGAIGALAERGLVDLSGRRILVLGAGPTARSCIASFVANGAKTSIWNRTTTTAQTIAARLGATLWSPNDPTPDAILSALPPNAQISDVDVCETLRTTPIVIDANYGERATLAATFGSHVADGAAMLRASARASFALFRSVS